MELGEEQLGKGMSLRTEKPKHRKKPYSYSDIKKSTETAIKIERGEAYHQNPRVRL